MKHSSSMLALTMNESIWSSLQHCIVLRAVMRHMPTRMLLMLLIALMEITSPSSGKDQGDTTVSSTETRIVSFFVTMGYPEIGALGIQVQPIDQFSLAVKRNGVILGGEDYILPANAPGWGVKATYYYDQTGDDTFLKLNSVNLEIAYLTSEGLEPSSQYKHGSAIEISIGRQLTSKGFKFIWAVGAGINSFTDRPKLVSASIKIGLQLNV